MLTKRDDETQASFLIRMIKEEGKKDAANEIAALKARVAILENAPHEVLKTFESLASTMVPEDYEQGYRQAVEHIISYINKPAVIEDEDEPEEQSGMRMT